MPKVSKESASKGGDYGAVLDRAEDVDGYTINFVWFREDVDATPLYKGLPDDRCQCPHWGYVVSGEVTFQYADGEEKIEAGEASRRRSRRARPSTSRPGTSRSSIPRHRARPVQPRRAAGQHRGGDGEEHEGDAAGLSGAQAGTGAGN
jgi:hypothetical protein